MSVSHIPVSSVAFGAGAATFLFMSVLLGIGDASAEGREFRSLPGMTIHADAAPAIPMTLPPPASSLTTLRRETPSIPGYTAPAEPGDAAAALEAVDVALTQASDGATYVWRRHHGRLAGTVRPTSTFRDADGRMCRHIEIQLRLGTYQRRTEGVACRGQDGVWLLEG